MSVNYEYSGLRSIVEGEGMRAAAGLADRWRRPVIASAPRQALLGIRGAISQGRRGSTTKPMRRAGPPGAANGTPGSTQLRLTPKIRNSRPIDPVEREPPRRFFPPGRCAEGRATAGSRPANLQLTTPVEPADRCIEPLAQARGSGGLSGSSRRVRNTPESRFNAAARRSSVSASKQCGFRQALDRAGSRFSLQGP